MTISGLLIIWLRQCLLGIWKGFLFPLFSYCRFWKEVTIHRSGRPCPAHLRTEHLYQVFVILLCDGFVYSLPFIYLLGHLFMLISTHRSSLDFTLLLSTAFSQWFQLCPLGTLSVRLMCHFIIVDFIFSFLPSFLFPFLLSDITRCSRLIFSLPCPSIGHFSREAWFLLLNNDVRNKTVIVGTGTSDSVRRYTGVC